MNNDIEQLSVLTESILRNNNTPVKEKEIIKEEHDPSIDDDGWNKEYFDDIGLTGFLEKTSGMIYEIQNCVRGANTGCKTRDEIEHYLIELREELDSIIQGI
jgi:hypothetical protein